MRANPLRHLSVSTNLRVRQLTGLALALVLGATMAGTLQPVQAQSAPSAPASAGRHVPPGQTLATPEGAPAVYKGTSGAVDFSANSVAAQLVVEVARDGVPADGQSAVPVTLLVFGADGKPLTGKVFATIEHSGGRILLPGAATDEFGPMARDADRTTPGVQIEVSQGVGHFKLLAPMTPQDVQLRVTVGEQEALGRISFVPDLREMVAVGLVEGIINLTGRGRIVEPTRNNDTFEREIRNFSRVSNNGKTSVGLRSAVFLKGVVKGDVLLTAAYDSDKETRSRLLSDIKPDEFYPVYGDASLRGEEAKSAGTLYVRIDQKKSYLLYGDFATGDGFSQRSGAGATATVQQRSLGAYNRSATGLLAHYETAAGVGNVFAVKDTLRQVVEEFASQGSGPYGLRNNRALQDSEKVEVLVRDRNQPSRILSTRPLLRLRDYIFEPFSGRIILNQFLPGFDKDLNPRSLRVSYEVDQGGDAFWVFGADGQLPLGNSLELGGSVVQDRNPLAPNRLGSANLSWRITPQTMVVAEVAQTRTQVNTNSVNQSSIAGLAGRIGEVSGQAWRVELNHEDERAQVRVFVGQSDPTFSNLASPLTGGHAEAFVSGSYKVADTAKVYALVQRSEDRAAGSASRDSAQVGWSLNLTDRLVLDVGLRSLRESAGATSGVLSSPFASTSGLSGSIATGSGGGAVGFGNQSLDPATGLPIIQSGNGLGGARAGGFASNGLRSDSVRAGLAFKVTDFLTLGAELEHAVNGEPRQRFALGVDYQLGERTRLYGRAERQTGLSGPSNITTDARDSNALVFGVDTSYWRDTQVFSEYRLRDAISGSDNQLASGVRNSWDVAPGLRLNTALEMTRVVSGQAPTTRAVSVGIDYSAHALWRGSSKLELRSSGDVAGTPENEAFRTSLWQISVARKLDRDWTLLARNYLLKTDYSARGDVAQDRLQVGVAYRDTDTNRVNALAKYEYKTERDDSNPAVGTLSSVAHIVSVHADWHPSRPWWTTARLAAKWQNDQFERGLRDSFRAQLVSGRLIYDVTENWDVGLTGAVQFGQHAARQRALGLEAGYLLRQNLWLSLGYNSSGFSGDADLRGYEYTRRGLYLRLRFKFDQDLFSSGNKTINRTLDR